MKKILSLIFSILFLTTLSAQPMPGSLQDIWEATKDKPVTVNPYTLIIYRPQNNGIINNIRCFLKLEDEEGNDVTHQNCRADKYYISGGMAIHLELKKGRYKISFYTPKDKQNNFVYPTAGTRPFEWKSNVFEYNTENPAKVIFLYPTMNDNGFYNGGWFIDYKEK